MYIYKICRSALLYFFCRYKLVLCWFRNDGCNYAVVYFPIMFLLIF